MSPCKQLYAFLAYGCLACVQRDGYREQQRGAHSSAAEANKAKHNHHNYSYFIHRTTVDAHKSTRLSAGTYSLHTPLQPRVVYASADTASSSGAHIHAELLRLPSISRRLEGARVVVVVGAPVVVVLGACVVVVVVVVVGASAFFCSFAVTVFVCSVRPLYPPSS
ncbi:hypothetical protein TcG_13327 [Trypanosoma cruzi]|nr:hypothetical protein TcG_13327 [Trypanosoma cruzi]